MADIEEVNKGGESWLQMSIDRTSAGLLVWVKADPRVEEFMSTLSAYKTAPATEKLSDYGTNWRAVPGAEPITLYKLYKPVRSTEYTLDNPCGNAFDDSDRVNLSFLRFIGIGAAGTSFIIDGPFNEEDLRKAYRNVLRMAARFFKEYIVPVHVNLRISSQEL